jgi:hypothetical protein
MLDLQQALLDPSSVFKTPNDVVIEANLTKEQKIKILRRWEYDVREQEVAEEENMPNMPPDILSDIYRALAKLGAKICHEHSAPTKQGGE